MLSRVLGHNLRAERCRFLSVIFLAGGGIIPFLNSSNRHLDEGAGLQSIIVDGIFQPL
jgi:hypothetical protein